MIETVKRISAIPLVKGIKFHHLYILENTPLYEIYKRGEYEPLSYEEYKKLLFEVIQYLREDIVVHRIIGEDNSGHLVAPRWRLNKNFIVNDVKKSMMFDDIYQGKLCK